MENPNSLNASAHTDQTAPKSENGAVTEITTDPNLEPAALASLLASEKDDERGTVSAKTIAQLMGLATVTDLRLIGAKVDLMLAKVNAMQVRLEKTTTVLSTVPTGTDLERIDVQIGALRSLIRELLSKSGISLNEGDLAALGAKGGKAHKPKQAATEEPEKA